MAYSYTQAVGTGSVLAVAVPPYLDKSHIFVFIDGVPFTAFEWVNDQTIGVLAERNSLIRVVRRTSPDARLTAYLNGQALPGEVLEIDSKQAFFLAQEAMDAALLSGGSPAGGLPPGTELTVDLVRDLLTGQIAPSQLEESLRNSIGLITDGADSPGSVAWRVAQEAAQRASAIAAEAQARATALVAEANNRTAAIAAERQERATYLADANKRIDRVVVGIDNNSAAILEEARSRLADVDGERQARAAAIADANSRVDSAFSKIEANSATIQAEAQERVDAGQALASQLGTTQARLDSMRALVYDMVESVVDRLHAQSRRTQAQRADMEQGLLAANAAILEEQTARAGADGALALQLGELQASYKAADSTLQASVASEAAARSTADAALSTQLTELDAAYKAADSQLQASVTNEAAARASADSSLATQLTELDAAYKAADAQLQASVTQEAGARADADSSLASQLTALDTAYKAADSKLQTSVTNEATARANADATLGTQLTELTSTVNSKERSLLSTLWDLAESFADRFKALARRLTMVQANLEDADRQISASVATEAQARADGDAAVGSQLLAIDAAYKQGDDVTRATIVALEEATSSLKESQARDTRLVRAELEGADAAITASVVAEAKARADGDGALASQLTALDAAYKSADSSINAAITAEQTARANGDSAHATSIAALDAAYKAADSALNAAIVTEQTARASGDSANASSITALQSRVTTAESELATASTRLAAVEVSAATNATATEGVEANYTIKVQARTDGKQAIAGIGLNSSVNNNVAQSELVFMADKMTFVPSAANYNGTPQPLFTTAQVNGVNTFVIPAGRFGDKLLEARMIVDGGVEARHMKITGGGAEKNMDPYTSDVSAWVNLLNSTKPTIATGITDIPGGGTTALQNPTDAESRPFCLEFIPVDLTKNYRVEGLVRQLGGTAGKFYLSVAWYDANKTLLTSSTAQPTGAGSPAGWFGNGTYSYAASGTAPSSWTLYKTTFGPNEVAKIPSNAKFMRIGAILNYQAAVGAAVQITGLKVTEMLDSSLVVTGGIAADRIDTRGLTIKDSAGKVIFGAGTGISSSGVAFGLSGNLLRNSDFLADAVNGAGWIYLSFSGTTTYYRDLAISKLAGGHTMCAYTTGANSSEWAPYYTDTIVVNGGGRYECTMYAGALRCDVDACIYWYDATSDVNIAETSVGICTAAEAAGGALLSGYKRIGAFFTAPPNAAYARVCFTKRATYGGKADSYGFLTLPYFGVAGPAQTEFSPWKPGPASGIGNLDQITAESASTYIANAAIGAAQIGSLSAGVLNTTMGGGLLSGGRITMEANKLQVFDATNALRVKVGYLL